MGTRWAAHKGPIWGATVIHVGLIWTAPDEYKMGPIKDPCGGCKRDPCQQLLF